MNYTAGDVWNVLLEDDHTSSGGTTHTMETVGEFVEEAGESKSWSLEQLNKSLVLYGIKAVRPSDEQEDVQMLKKNSAVRVKNEDGEFIGFGIVREVREELPLNMQVEVATFDGKIRFTSIENVILVQKEKEEAKEEQVEMPENPYVTRDAISFDDFMKQLLDEDDLVCQDEAEVSLEREDEFEEEDDEEHIDEDEEEALDNATLVLGELFDFAIVIGLEESETENNEDIEASVRTIALSEDETIATLIKVISCMIYRKSKEEITLFLESEAGKMFAEELFELSDNLY